MNLLTKLERDLALAEQEDRFATEELASFRERAKQTVAEYRARIRAARRSILIARTALQEAQGR
jgi:ElaB/YqjD/DUF883 family membrane-anchored ribosome-binding protein